MFGLPLFRGNGHEKRPPQPYSKHTLEKHPAHKRSDGVDSVCPYCAVGCATSIHTKGGEVIDIEGNPEQPDQ